jgi:hypothetical protein
MNKYFISNFKFTLVEKANLTNDAKFIEGIVGLNLKGNNNFHKYSLIEQLYSKEIIKDKYFIIDITNGLFIAESPDYIHYNMSYVKCNGTNDNFWKCNANSISVDDNDNNSTNNNYYIDNNVTLIFDSGTNGIIVPKYLHNEFKEKVFHNLITYNICYEDYYSYNLIQFKCNDNVTEIQNNMLPMINIYIDKTQLHFNVSKLYNNNTKIFDIYFYDFNVNGWVIGVPFFEQFPILFNKTEGNTKIFYSTNTKILPFSNNNTITLGKRIFYDCIIIFIILFCLRIIVNCLKKQSIEENNTNNDENEPYKQLSELSLFRKL